MHIAICNSNYLANHASAHTRAILSHSNSRAAVALSVESIVTAAVSQLHYTRSVAIVSKQIMNRLKCEAGPQLAHKFTECLVDAVGGVFFAYWRERTNRVAPGYAPNKTADAVNPIALCAFVGDLLSIGTLNLSEFEDCFRYLSTLAPTGLLLESIYALFAHGGAHRHPEMTPAYLLRCIATIERKCAAYKGVEILEERKLTSLIYNVMFRTGAGFVADVVDRRLDLDTALTTSVCSPLIGWLYDAPTSYSPGPRPSTGSCAKGQKKLFTQLPQTTVRPCGGTQGAHSSSTLIKRVESVSLVLHMPRPVSGVQWVQYFRDYSG